MFVLLLLTIPMSPNANDVIVEGQLDKVAHFFMFGIFSYLVILTFKNVGEIIFLIGIFAGIFYAALGEYIQSYLPSRTVSSYDFYAGAIGALLFTIYYYVKSRKA